MSTRHRFILAAVAALVVSSSPAAEQGETAAAEQIPVSSHDGPPAERGLPSCGGIGVQADWASTGAAESDLSTVEEALDADGRVPVQGRFVRAFTVTTPTQVRLEVAGRLGGDPYLSVLDELGNEIAADDDGGGNYAARIETVLQPGRYCALARGYDDEAMDVTLRLGRVDHLPLTAGSGEQRNASCEADDLPRLSETPLDATAIADGIAMSATVASTPAWRFELAEPTAVTLTARSGDGDPSIRLLDLADGSLLAENDDADDLNSRIDMAGALPSGSYCVEVQDLNGADSPVTVRLSAFDPKADRLRRIDAAEFSPLSGDDVPVLELGPLDTLLVKDVFVSGQKGTWLRFDMPEDGLVVLEAVGGQYDPTVVMFDRAGRRIAENDDGPNGRDSFLARRLASGSYLVAVRLLDGETSGTVRILLERYVAAR